MDGATGKVLYTAIIRRRLATPSSIFLTYIVTGAAESNFDVATVTTVPSTTFLSTLGTSFRAIPGFENITVVNVPPVSSVTNGATDTVTGTVLLFGGIMGLVVGGVVMILGLLGMYESCKIRGQRDLVKTSTMNMDVIVPTATDPNQVLAPVSVELTLRELDELYATEIVVPGTPVRGGYRMGIAGSCYSTSVVSPGIDGGSCYSTSMLTSPGRIDLTSPGRIDLDIISAPVSAELTLRELDELYAAENVAVSAPARRSIVASWFSASVYSNPVFGDDVDGKT